MGWTEVWQYSKLVKYPLENQYFASYIAIAAVYFERICMYVFQNCAFLLSLEGVAEKLSISNLNSNLKSFEQ